VSEKLKENWSVDLLSNLSSSIDYGHTASATFENTETKFLRITDIQNGFVYWENVPFCECTEPERKRYELADGDIVFARTGATTGKSYLIKDCPPKSVFASYLIRVRPNDRINPNYLFQYFQTSDYWRQISARSSGTAQAGVNASKLGSLQIPLPPLPEQKRIAEVLDKADALREKRRLALQKLDTLLQSVFLEMFGDPVKNPKGWEVESLINLIDESRPITYGILKPGDDIEDGVPYIRVLDMKDGEVLVDGVRRTTPKISNEYKRSILKFGDLLMSIRGHVGRLAIVPEVLAGANITQDTARLAPNDKCNVHYLHDCLKSVYFQREMKRYVKGMAVQGINLGDVKELKIPVPPLSLQEKFASISLHFKKLRNESVKSKKMSESLFQSLQQRAFKGELFSNELPPVEPQEENVWKQTSAF